MRECKISDLSLEPLPVVSKNQKLAEIIHLMVKLKTDRVVVSTGGVLSGIVTVKDIFLKMSTKRMAKLSPASVAVSGLMSDRLLSISESESLLKASQILHENQISGLPVLSEDYRVRGLLTKMAVIKKLRGRYHVKVEEVLVPHSGSIEATAKLPQALEKIRKSPMRELAVLDKMKPVGVIGEREVALVLFNALSSDAFRHFDAVLERMKVKDVMKPVTSSISPDTDLNVAIDMLTAKRLKTLPVTVKQEVVGLVTRDAIFTYLLEREKGVG